MPPPASPPSISSLGPPRAVPPTYTRAASALSSSSPPTAQATNHSFSFSPSGGAEPFQSTLRGRAMALGALGCSSILPCRSRSGRPHPISFLGIITFLSCWGCPSAFFLQPSDCGAGGGSGDGSAGSDDEEDGEAQPVPTKGATNRMGAEGIHFAEENAIEQLRLDVAAMRHSLASIEKHLKTIVNFHALLQNLLTRMENSMAVVTNTPANKDAVNRMKGLLGSMHSVADKLLMFCSSVLAWLLSNSSALNSPAPNPKAAQNFEDPWIQVLIIGSLILYLISFITMFLASKLKDSESIDGVLFKIFMWLLLLVFLGLWTELCMIVHIFAHTPKFVLWPLGTLFSILSVAFWFLGLYKEQEKILNELKQGCVRNPESEAASAQGLDLDNSYSMQISEPSSRSDALSK